MRQKIIAKVLRVITSSIHIELVINTAKSKSRLPYVA